MEKSGAGEEQAQGLSAPFLSLSLSLSSNSHPGRRLEGLGQGRDRPLVGVLCA